MSKQPKCPKVLKESAKSDLVSLGRESQRRFSHHTNPLFAPRKQPTTKGFAPCNRLFWVSPCAGPKTPFALSLISGLQKGPAERGHVKKRQKSSKSVKKFFDTFDNFRAGQKTSKIVKKCQKVFDTFRQFSRGTIFPAPFGGL